MTDSDRTATPLAPGGPADAGAAREGYCANHPNVETALRCNRCGKYICTRCAVRTPVGYRCKECVRSQQSVYFTAGAGDYLVAFLIAVPLSLLAGFLASLLSGFLFWLIFLIGPIGGTLVSDIVFRAVRRRRGRYLWLVVAGSVALGFLPFLALALLGGNLLGAGLLALYGAMSVGAAVSRLRFGR